MYKNGFIKTMAATPKIIVGDIDNNKEEILKILNTSNAGVIVFPELSITGYSYSDLFFQEKTLKDSLEALNYIVNNNTHQGISTIGMPIEVNGAIYNCGVVIQGENILGVIPKYYLPNHNEFSEKRWFISGFQANFTKINLFNKEVPFGRILFKDRSKDLSIGVEVCQDVWSIKSPGDDLALAGANLILNLSASPETIGKDTLRRNAVLDASRRQMSAYIYSTSGMYESSSETIFSSHKIIASMGELLIESPLIEYEATNLYYDINLTAINFKRRKDSNYRDCVNQNVYEYQTVEINIKEDNKFTFSNQVNQTPFVPNNDLELEKINQILTASLVKKLTSMPSDSKKIVIGVSGGLDSTHALIIAHNAFKVLGLPLTDIIPVIMPAEVSASKNMDDAFELITGLGLTPKTINIKDSVNMHLNDLEHDLLDTTYENAQARMRTLILMNLANKHKGFVLGTGDLSEIALGFMTYNGDQMSMYGINSGLPKTTIQKMTTYFANNEFSHIKDCLLRIVNKQISPELLKDQNTEDIIGSYLINDFIIYYHLDQGLDEIKLTWLIKLVFNLKDEEAKTYVNRFIRLFYNQQFKRNTMPEGPKVFALSLSPRASFKLPSDVIRK